ncbi:hypothetical protein PHACT_12495 [Pseudohongiella acticola]|uniref:Uncharacterized protein n=1 Tax=Pseudohongiella acticola TaxID=1524254 RepID=A0A1E8CFX7_9GAMM|nr:hypothetical protein [Pseudohongiella acticola]OFE11370.1 hypothetical protein PHACT_12495 [Pseudohongiella acticola]
MTKSDYEKLAATLKSELGDNVGSKLTPALATGLMACVLEDAAALIVDEKEGKPSGKSNRTAK